MATIPLNPVLGLPDPSNFQIYSWDPTAADDPVLHKYILVTSHVSIPVGKGFWIKKVGALDFAALNGVPLIPTDVNIQVLKGWNMIGNPFLRDISWDYVTVKKGSSTYTIQQAADLGLIDNTPFECTASGTEALVGEYATNNLKTWQGYFLYAGSDGVSLNFSPTADNSRSTAKAVRFAPEPYINLAAASGISLDLGIVIGLLSGASDKRDGYDVHAPVAPMGDYVSLYFPHNDWGDDSGNYSIDIRPPIGNDADAACAGVPPSAEFCKVWNFTVEASKTNGNIDISWYTLHKYIGLYSIILTDLAASTDVDMTANYHYEYTTPVSNPPARNFRIKVVKNGTPATLDSGLLNLNCDWCLVSFPVEFLSKTPILNFFGETGYLPFFQYYDGKLTEVYDPGGIDYQTGIGYWVWVRGVPVPPPQPPGMPIDIQVEGIPTSSMDTIDVPLKQGWNPIGDPFNQTVNWDDHIHVICGTNDMPLSIAISGNWVGAKIYGYNNNGYYPVAVGGSIAPWTGYFMKANADCTLRLKTF